MKILVATRLSRTAEEEDEVDATMQALRTVGADAELDSSIDWGLLFSIHCGRTAGYASVAQDYDHIALIEGWSDDNGYYLSRGQCALVDAFWKAGKTASVWRASKGRIVHGLEPISDDWGGAFMRAKVEDGE